MCSKNECRCERLQWEPAFILEEHSSSRWRMLKSCLICLHNKSKTTNNK